MDIQMIRWYFLEQAYKLQYTKRVFIMRRMSILPET